MRPRLLALACLLALATACSGDDKAAPTPTLFPQLRESPGPTTIPPPVPTQLPPLEDLASTIWLIDAASGRVTTLYEDTQRPAPFAMFDDDPPSVLHGAFEGDEFVIIRRDLDGGELERERDSATPRSFLWPLPWSGTPDGCEVDGRLYPGVPCGQISPNGRWMTYQANVRALEPTGQEHDLWVLDLATGETRLLQSGLFQCTQCDAGPPFGWSASGNYLFVGDAGRDNRVLLVDIAAGTARDISIDEIDRSPVWSPAGDLLLRPAGDGATIVEDLAAGAETTLPDLLWPARFDPSGVYAYSTGYGRETHVVDVRAGSVVATLEGGGRYDPAQGGQLYLGIPGGTVAATDGGGFIAALANVTGCEGTAIYEGSDLLTCVEGGGAGSVSPGGEYVVLARKTGETGFVDAPWIQAIGLDIFEIVLVDVATARERTIADGAMGLQVPYILWNAEGTHLLVGWPFQYGP